MQGKDTLDSPYYMAELFQRQGSIYEGNHPSCLWGLLQFFDFDQRLHGRKMLAYRRRGEGRRAGRAKFQKSKLGTSSVEDTEFSDSKANLLMEDKDNATKKHSGKARIRTLISKLYKKQDRKKKISPLASQLLRTISIHHLECNDYVIPDETTSDSETSTVEANSHEIDSPVSNELVALFPRWLDGSASGHHCPADCVDHHPLNEHLLNKHSFLMEKLNKAKDALLKHNGADAKEVEVDVALQLKEFPNMSDGSGELFLRILENPNSLFENYIQPRQYSSPEIVLTKSRSFPGAGLSGKRNGEISKFKQKEVGSLEVMSQAVKSLSVSKTINDDSQASSSDVGAELDILKPKPESLDSAETCSSFEFLPDSPRKLENQRDRGTVLNRFKVLKQRIKDVIRDNRNEQQRISMDGFLHKIPYGHKMPHEPEKEKLKLWDGPTSVRYNRESLRCKSSNDGSVSANGKSKHIQRSRSLTESLDRYSGLLKSISVKESKRPLERLMSIQEQDRKTPKTWGRILSNPEFMSIAFGKDVSTELSDAPALLEIPASGVPVSSIAVDTHDPEESATPSALVHTGGSMKLDVYVEHTGIEMEQHVLINEHEKSKPYEISDDLSTEEGSNVPFHEQESAIEVESPHKSRPSPISVPDSNLQEDPVSPLKYSVSEGSEMNPGWVTFEELHSGINNVSNGVENIGADFDQVQMPIDLVDFNASEVQVDTKYEAEFNYVRDIVKKFGFGGKDLLEAWYTSFQLADPLETDDSHHELNMSKDESDDMPFDHQLLFGLINEILLDIYSLSHSPGFSRFGSRLRPKSVGNHLLEEVWEKISWYLSYQLDLNPTLDHIKARDFAKNDGWMNLQRDAECVGIEIEGLILDDLLEEVIHGFGDLPCSRCIVS